MTEKVWIQTKALPSYSLTYILFFEGFASVAVQIILMRQLTPFVGSNVVINTLILAANMAALAIGYKNGGNVQTNHLLALSRNLFYSGLILGTFASYVFLDFIFSFDDKVKSIYILVCYLMICIMPLVILLGQTVPILTNFIARDNAAKITGYSFNISTWGNVLGILCTGILSLVFLGVAWSITINSVICILLSVYVASFLDKKPYDAQLISITIGVIAIINIGFENYYFDSTSVHSNIKVVDSTDGGRQLIINRSLASLVTKKGDSAPYIERMENIIFDGMDIKNSNILVLGAGGFTFESPVDHNNIVTFVDIDDNLLKISEERLIRKKVTQGVVFSDAIEFLNQENGTYDVIVIDLYSNRVTIPWFFSTFEFYSKVRDRLNKDGKVVVNIVGSTWGEDKFTSTVDATIRAAFGLCRTDIGSYSTNVSNIIYICTKESINGSRVYTDQKYTSDIDLYFDG